MRVCIVVPYDLVEQAYVGYVYGDSTAGQAAIYGVGLTGIPVFNLNNNCSTGSSALFLARQAVESGMVECAIALGFEQMQPGALKGAWDDRPSPMAKFAEAMTAKQGFSREAPLVPNASRKVRTTTGERPQLRRGTANHLSPVTGRGLPEQAHRRIPR